MTRIRIWISALRLRTLPLATASIGLGSLLAAGQGAFSWRVALLCFGTAVLLQILSNLANDYGDSVHGADSKARIGPRRVTQSGKVSLTAMKKAVLIVTTLCLGVGYVLIRSESLLFHAAGIAAILAAIAYTAGPKPYGYAGLGDLFVFLFFGIVGVGGTFYLHTHELSYSILLPATACGLFCVAVLNINNMRDIDSDKAAGKITIPVRLGLARARVYHNLLLIIGVLAATAYCILRYEKPWQWLFLISVPLLIKNGLAIRASGNTHFDPYLRQMAITTLVFCFSFGLGYLF